MKFCHLSDVSLTYGWHGKVKTSFNIPIRELSQSAINGGPSVDWNAVKCRQTRTARRERRKTPNKQASESN